VALAAAFVIASDQHSAGFFGAVLLLPFSAQNAQIRAASVLTGTEPASAQNGGYFASSSWAFVTESDVVLNRQAIASGMGLWCQAYQGTLAG
jgi:hypothetical protein